jgi:glycosyltransferase involved in cell wall biosynthesis
MSEPLVSIVIPAYRARFFAEALASARAQAYGALEILVLDDSPGEEIERRTRNARDDRVRYVRNPERLGFHGNFSAGFRQARGEFIKFLNDDDRLLPGCVPCLAHFLRVNSSVTLATSRRFVIDEAGRRGPDVTVTIPLAHVTAFVPGEELGNFVLMNMMNLIGEPTTVMFRRRDVVPEEDSLFRWGGEDYHCLADLSLWLRLLTRGAAFYCAEGLSEFRIHPGQEQEASPDARLGCIVERRRLLWRAREAGFLSQPHQLVAALRAAHAFAASNDLLRASPDLAERVRQEMRALDEEIAIKSPI